MSQIFPSQLITKDHQFFDTLKRYSQRLNQQKNTSLSYLQTINKLSDQLNNKDLLIQKIRRQNYQLRQKLNLYEQVMTRSRFLMRGNGSVNHSVNGGGEYNYQPSNVFIQQPSFHQNAKLRMSRFIQKQKITESILQTRNQAEYLKQLSQEMYEGGLDRKVQNTKQSFILMQDNWNDGHNITPYYNNQQNSNYPFSPSTANNHYNTPSFYNNAFQNLNLANGTPLSPNTNIKPISDNYFLNNHQQHSHNNNNKISKNSSPMYKLVSANTNINENGINNHSHTALSANNNVDRVFSNGVNNNGINHLQRSRITLSSHNNNTMPHVPPNANTQRIMCHQTPSFSSSPSNNPPINYPPTTHIPTATIITINNNNISSPSFSSQQPFTMINTNNNNTSNTPINSLLSDSFTVFANNNSNEFINNSYNKDIFSNNNHQSQNISNNGNNNVIMGQQVNNRLNPSTTSTTVSSPFNYINPSPSFNDNRTLFINEKIIQKQKSRQKINFQNQNIFPLFQEFVIIKPSENIQSSPDNLESMKLVCSMTQQKNGGIKKGNKIFQSISTYLCHNTGQGWVQQDYKPQTTTLNKNSNKSIATNNSGSQKNISNPFQNTDDMSIYLSNSQQTLLPLNNNKTPSKSKPPHKNKFSQLYQQFNPSLYYFGVCYKSHTLQYINSKLFKVPLIYCFVTRYPFLKQWRQVLETIVQRLNVKSQKELSGFMKELEGIKERSVGQQGMFFISHARQNQQFKFTLLQKQFKWKKLCIGYNFQNLNTNINQNLTHYGISAQKQPPRYKYQSVNSNNFINKLQIQQQNSAIISIKLFPPELILDELYLIFSSYSVQLIIDVLLLLLLQIPIAIISKNQSLLQKFILYFIYIIKPLKYPFPIIFNLPSTMTIVLQSPFPSFIGITDPSVIQPYIYQRTVFDLDQKIAKSWPNIQFYNQSRECVVRWMNKELGSGQEGSQSEIVKLEKINQIVKILTSSSKYYPEELKDLRTYRKYFKKTEIWHIYHHQREQRNKQSVSS